MPETKAFDQLASLLEMFGLDSETLLSWVEEQIVAGESVDRVMIELRERPEYKARFPAMEARRKAGLPAISEAEYFSLENQYRAILRNAGMPRGFYDSPEDFSNWISKDVSPVELEKRVSDGVLAALNEDPETKAILSQFYGIGQTTQALAAYFLDPERALPLIEKQFATARIAAAADRTGGFRLSRDQADRLRRFGVDENAAAQGFAEIANQAPLYSERISEDDDLRALREGVNANLLGDPTARRALTQRLQERQAAFGGGGAVSDRDSSARGLGKAS